MAEPTEREPQDLQNIETPEQLPLLPVRDIVVFPYMVLPLFVGREMSIKPLEAEAVMRTVKEQIERIISLGKVLMPDVMVVIENMDDPGRLADMVVSNLGLKVEVTQDVLELTDPIVRLKRVSEILAKEIDV